MTRTGTRAQHVGHDGGVRVFVDGRDVLTVPERVNPAQPDRSAVDGQQRRKMKCRWFRDHVPQVHMEFPMTGVPADAISALRPRTKDGAQFVLYGDCCSGVPGTPFAANFAAVNQVVQRLRPAPDFIVFAGDHVYGMTDDYQALRSQWRHWHDREMSSLESAHSRGMEQMPWPDEWRTGMGASGAEDAPFHEPRLAAAACVTRTALEA